MTHYSYQSKPDVTHPMGEGGARRRDTRAVQGTAGGIPAGSQARIFLNHVRLIDADFLRKRHKDNQNRNSAYTQLAQLAEQGWLGQGSSSSDSIDLRKELRGGRRRWGGNQPLFTPSQVCEKCDDHVSTSGDG